MRTARACGAGLAVACWLAATGAGAQVTTPISGETASPLSQSLSSPVAFALPAGVADTGTAAPEPSRSFLKDVLADYRNMFSVENGEWFAVGAVGSLALHGADAFLREETEEETATLTNALKGGTAYGNLAAQVPLALVWWGVGYGTGNGRAASAGRDLMRAQLSALSWTYVLKYAVSRDRPNGDPRSFPSGHASATFATAMVLQQHYGWKVGVPFFALSTYTAASRITANKHWASDVAFGSVVGMVCGRTVTVRMRHANLRVVPQVRAGGGAVFFTSVR